MGAEDLRSDSGGTPDFGSFQRLLWVVGRLPAHNTAEHRYLS
jgi:hypothetical protein